ncbi:MAG: hypothetical protein ACI9CE_001675 [Flavobacterium sp.]|jgi:hypothetical protein
MLDRALVLSIEGDVDYPTFSAAIERAEVECQALTDFHLIINGDGILRFNIPNLICQQQAPKLFNQSGYVAFFSSAPLAFGMARVMQTYSFNDRFAVFKTYEAAVTFVSAERLKFLVNP